MRVRRQRHGRETAAFTPAEAARIARLPASTIDYWDRSGFLRPSAAAAKEHERRYSFQDLVALRVARQLREAGISLQALRRVVELLRARRRLASPLAETYLVTDGVDVYEKQGDDTFASVLQNPGQGCLFVVLDLGRTAEEVERAVEALHQGRD